MTNGKHISAVLDRLADNPSQVYLSNSIQVADLLQWVLDQTGAANVKMTSFSISEEFLRRLFFIEQANLIKSIDIVLDFKATNKTLILWPFIAQTVQNCYLASNHSKILLVYNDSWTVTAVMSQNLTRGNRFESAFISTDRQIFESLHRQVEDVISNQSIPFNDVFSRTIRDN